MNASRGYLFALAVAAALTSGACAASGAADAAPSDPADDAPTVLPTVVATCDADGREIVILSSDGVLSRYNPRSRALTRLSQIQGCPTSGDPRLWLAGGFAVDDQRQAYVWINTGDASKEFPSLHRVDLDTGKCDDRRVIARDAPAATITGEHGSATFVGSTLYGIRATGGSPGGYADLHVVRVDLVSGGVEEVVSTFGPTALTGERNGRLAGYTESFTNDVPPSFWSLDPLTGESFSEFPPPELDWGRETTRYYEPDGFASWGGSDWLFSRNIFQDTAAAIEVSWSPTKTASLADPKTGVVIAGAASAPCVVPPPGPR